MPWADHPPAVRRMLGARASTTPFNAWLAEPVPRRGREKRDDASDLPGDRAPGRRHRPGAVAGVHRLAEALPIRLDFLPVDLRLENRRAKREAIYDEAVETITATRVALKHPTTTAEESPNAILRRRLDLSVIHRPVYTIPGVPTNFRRELDLDIVRIATGGTYDDPGRMIGEDGAVSLRIVERRPVREAARYAFNLARKTGKRVTSSSKYTIQKATDGLFEQVDDRRSPAVPRGAPLRRAVRRACWARSSWRPRSSRSCWS